MLVMDVDGTLTDGKLYYSSDGSEIKSFNVKDGYAIKKILPRLNIIPVIITGRTSDIVLLRAKELNILEVHQGISNKSALLDKLLVKYNLCDSQIAYVGDDLNDLEVLKRVSFRVCPNDAVNEVKEICNYISEKNGGEGVIRDFVDNFLSHDSQIITIDR